MLAESHSPLLQEQPNRESSVPDDQERPMMLPTATLPTIGARHTPEPTPDWGLLGSGEAAHRPRAIDESILQRDQAFLAA